MIATMPTTTAGLLLFRRRDAGIEVFLVHPGGPFWAKKDDGAWSLPKGLLDSGEEPLAAARREFREETGRDVPAGEAWPLPPLRQGRGKVLHAWALEGDVEGGPVTSNTFEMEWPPRSGRRASFPEVDRTEWFDLERARQKILPGQRPLLDDLARLLGA